MAKNNAPAFSEIRVLSGELIHRIAAGEVVDRPASALKELLENSVDAGAKAIRIQVVEGGLKRLEIEDDGCGFGKKNLETAVQRHATSKISKIEDLDQIFTLGFRGEALSAIASVSKMTIDSRRPNEEAYQLQIIGGSKQDIVPGYRKVGTKITIDELFFNVPARKKFLKRPASEAQECQSVLEKLALSHPEIAFEWFIIDAKGEIKEQASLEATDLLTRFNDVLKVNATPLAIEAPSLPPGFHSFRVCFFPPPVGAGNQKKIFLTVNGRSLLDKRLPYALREAFAGLIEVGQYPVAHVICEVDPEKIDVNIHPQKKEIRWPNEISLAGMVYRLIRPHFELGQNAKESAPRAEQSDFYDTLSPVTSAGPEASFAFSSSRDKGPSFDSAPPRQIAGVEVTVTAPPHEAIPTFVPRERETSAVNSNFKHGPMKFSSLRAVGEVGAAWLLCESPEGLVIIDQHAAHERVSFEKILAEKELWVAKPLLLPIELKIPYFLSEKIPEISRAMEALGFEISDENFEQKIMILAVPAPVRSLDWEKMIAKIFSRLDQDRSLESLFTDLRYQLAASLACHGSVRRGQRLGNEQIAELLKQMDELDWGGYCPHGRPVWFLLRHEKIEAEFHR